MPQQVYDNKSKIVLNWSSGKDAAYTYYVLQQSNEYEVSCLLTTINKEREKVVMHGVREELLDAQANAIGIPLKKIYLQASPTDDLYKKAMQDAAAELKQEGIVASAFGDIHLADLKKYREEQLAGAGIKGVFPIWQRDTREIVQMVEQVGIEAVVVCVNGQHLGREFLGRKVDASFLADLPDGVDPCGEYGEFHTFVCNAPYFSAPVRYEKGETVHQTYSSSGDDKSWDSSFYFLDLLPGS